MGLVHVHNPLNMRKRNAIKLVVAMCLTFLYILRRNMDANKAASATSEDRAFSSEDRAFSSEDRALSSITRCKLPAYASCLLMQVDDVRRQG